VLSVRAWSVCVFTGVVVRVCCVCVVPFLPVSLLSRATKRGPSPNETKKKHEAAAAGFQQPVVHLLYTFYLFLLVLLGRADKIGGGEVELKRLTKPRDKIHANLRDH